MREDIIGRAPTFHDPTKRSANSRQDLPVCELEFAARVP
jgi:hypothetical protein